MPSARSSTASSFEAAFARDADSASFRGQLILPGDEDYGAARQVRNPRFDRHPAVVARCADRDDVVSMLRLAREHGLQVAVRGSGHSLAGHSTCDHGIVIDMSRMNRLQVDPDRRMAFAEPGLTWGQLVDASQEHGLAAIGGIVSVVGISGLTLGGGIGWLVRSFGLACDSLVEAEVVTVDGDVVRASDDENADLLWGLRGGSGNLGIVTRFGLRLHPVGSLLAGAIVHPAERLGEVLTFFRDFCDSAPDTVNIVARIGAAPTASLLPAHLRGRPAVHLVVACIGPIAEAERVIAPLRQFGPPAADLVRPMPFAELQHLFDASSATQRVHRMPRSALLGALDDAALDAVVQCAAAMPSPTCLVGLQPLGGAVSAVPAEATAISHRDAAYMIEFLARWESDDDDPEPYRQWATTCQHALRPWSIGVDVNHLTDEEPVREAYDEHTYARLATLKRKYDPANLLRLNHNVEPSS